RKNDLRAIRRPRRCAVGATEAGKGDDLACVHGIHANLRTANATSQFEASESDSGGIGRPARSERNGAERSKRMLVAAVVIHGPNFFCAGARANEGDLRGSDAGHAGEPADDFVGKLMCVFPDLRIRWRTAIDLSEHRLRRRTIDIIEPTLY